MHETSLEAYRDFVVSGKISRLQLLAWTVLQQRGPSTAAEIDHYAERRGLWRRMSELKELGLIVEDEVRECGVTGRNCLTWRITKPGDKTSRAPRRRLRRWFLVIGDHSQVFTCAELAKTVANVSGAELIEVKEIRRKK